MPFKLERSEHLNEDELNEAAASFVVRSVGSSFSAMRGDRLNYKRRGSPRAGCSRLKAMVAAGYADGSRNST